MGRVRCGILIQYLRMSKTALVEICGFFSKYLNYVDASIPKILPV